jgi:hypothetical protein
MVRVNFPPYLFELDLAHAIDSRASIAAVGEGLVKFTLIKVCLCILPVAW